MWTCRNCSEEVEDQFGVCWNCEADARGTVHTKSYAEHNAQIADARDTQRKAFLNEKFRPKDCLRCNITMKYAGRKEFHEGPKLGAIGDFAELFVGQTNLEMYVCPNCLRVEFFAFD